jgi:hypothetical protein
VFICEKCREMVDPTSSDVIALEHWTKRPDTIDAPQAWLQDAAAHFHKRHLPKLGREWRRPAISGAMTEAAPGRDAPLPLDEP